MSNMVETFQGSLMEDSDVDAEEKCSKERSSI